ncbi:unnamed protein product, partial [marine sediment metagenome]
ADYIKRLGKTPEEHAREIVAKEKTRGNVVEYRTVLESLTSTKYHEEQQGSPPAKVANLPG